VAGKLRTEILSPAKKGTTLERLLEPSRERGAAEKMPASVAVVVKLV
jgi:hypothetical protein